MIDGLGVLTTTVDALSAAPGGMAFTIVDGALPDSLPPGGLLLVNPTAHSTAQTVTATLGLQLAGKAVDIHAGSVNDEHPLVSGMDLSALVVAEANKVTAPGWLETVVDWRQARSCSLVNRTVDASWC